MAAHDSRDYDCRKSTKSLETLSSQFILTSQLSRAQSHSHQVGEYQVLDEELFLQSLREYKMSMGHECGELQK